MSDTKQRRVDNGIMRLALDATNATLGKNGYAAVLHLARLERYLEAPPDDSASLTTPGEDFSALLSSIFTMYGEQASRGIFRRWGRHFGLAGINRRTSARLLKPMLSLLPFQRRAQTVLNMLVNEANAARGEELHTLQMLPEAYRITFRDCLYCHDLHPTETVCYTIVGTLEAVLHWGTGREFYVRETQCMACGAEACVFEIHKTRHD